MKNSQMYIHFELPHSYLEVITDKHAGSWNVLQNLITNYHMGIMLWIFLLIDDTSRKSYDLRQNKDSIFDLIIMPLYLTYSLWYLTCISATVLPGCRWHFSWWSNNFKSNFMACIPHSVGSNEPLIISKWIDQYYLNRSKGIRRKHMSNSQAWMFINRPMSNKINNMCWHHGNKLFPLGPIFAVEDPRVKLTLDCHNEMLPRNRVVQHSVKHSTYKFIVTAYRLNLWCDVRHESISILRINALPWIKI